MNKIGLVLACAAASAAVQGAEFALGVGAYEGRAAFKELRITDAAGKVVYSNDFATPDAVKGWNSAGRGAWKCGGGTLEQTFGGLGHEAVTLSIPQKFRNVTLTVKAKKIDGKEGFIVATGKNLIAGGGEWVIFGGWVNTQHGIEQPPFAIKKVPGSIEQGRWYDVKVECMDDRIRAWLDGRLVVESLAAVDTSGRPASIKPVKGGKAIKYSPMIFGQFIEHHDRQVYGGLFWPGHPLSDEDGFRKDVIEALREIKVPIVRWPGGCFVSAYHWKYGIGPKRQPMWDKAWEVEDPNTFGTDEYVKWCRKVGCEPYICTNAGSGNEEEMSDWVEYCNLNVGKWGRQRIANGYPKPHDVLYWSVGNENWGGWEMGAKTVAQWGPLVRESAKMMRGADRRIYLLAGRLPARLREHPRLLRRRAEPASVPRVDDADEPSRGDHRADHRHPQEGRLRRREDRHRVRRVEHARLVPSAGQERSDGPRGASQERHRLALQHVRRGLHRQLPQRLPAALRDGEDGVLLADRQHARRGVRA